MSKKTFSFSRVLRVFQSLHMSKPGPSMRELNIGYSIECPVYIGYSIECPVSKSGMSDQKLAISPAPHSGRRLY